MSYDYSQGSLETLFEDTLASIRGKLPSSELLLDDPFHSGYSPNSTAPESSCNGVLNTPFPSDLLDDGGSLWGSLTAQPLTTSTSSHLKDIDFSAEFFSHINKPDHYLNDAISNGTHGISRLDLVRQQDAKVLSSSTSPEVTMIPAEQLHTQEFLVPPVPGQEGSPASFEFPTPASVTSPVEVSHPVFIPEAPTTENEVASREPSPNTGNIVSVSSSGEREPKKALFRSPGNKKLKAQATARQQTLVQRIISKPYLHFSEEDKIKLAAEIENKKKPKTKPIKISMECLPNKIQEVLNTPHRCWIPPKQENAKLLVQLVERGYVIASAKGGVRKYRCRYHPEWLPTCQFTAAQSGSDMVRHLGTHANLERDFVDRGYVDEEDCTMLGIYKSHPGLSETIDPEFCTCYVCEINFVRKDSLERHYKDQHDAPMTLVHEIAAAVRGRKMNLET